MMAESGSKVDITPSMNRVKAAAAGSTRGYIGGRSQPTGDRILCDDVSQLVVGVLAGAIIGGEIGRTVAIVWAMNVARRYATRTF